LREFYNLIVNLIKKGGRKNTMNRKVITVLFISFISVCLVIGLLGRVAMAADRTGQAYERECTVIGGIEYCTARQYTSQYDLLKGEIYPEITMQYAVPSYQGMRDPFGSSYSYEGSAVGGLFTGPMMRFPVSGLSWMLGEQGAPRAQVYEYQNPFAGSMSYSQIYQGLGFQGSGLMLGPFRNLWGGGTGGYYSGGAGSGYGYPSLGGGFGTGWGFPWGGYTGGYTGSYPQRIY
jgi:hypothetical protein